MASTTHDDGFHEIQLNGKQLVFLFMAGTVVAVVIFLLGVFVGRGVRAQVGDPDPLIAQESSVAAPAVPPAIASTGSGAPATAQEDLGYVGDLQSPTPQAELRAPASKPPSSNEPARAAALEVSGARAAASSVPTEPAGDGFAIQLAALGKREEAETIVRRLTGKGYAAYLIAPSAGAPSVYRVRVGKFKDRREAETVSARLQKEEQFKPWIVR